MYAALTVLAVVGVLVWAGVVALATPTVAYRFGYRVAVGSREFEDAVSSALAATIVGGNRIARLESGARFYPAMLAAIAGARRVAFTGGAGISEWWATSYRGQPAWRDTMVRVEGPVVARCQAVFAGAAPCRDPPGWSARAAGAAYQAPTQCCAAPALCPWSGCWTPATAASSAHASMAAIRIAGTLPEAFTVIMRFPAARARATSTPERWPRSRRAP